MHPLIFDSFPAFGICLVAADIIGIIVAFYCAHRAKVRLGTFALALIILTIAALGGGKLYGFIERDYGLGSLGSEILSGYRFPGALVAVAVAVMLLGRVPRLGISPGQLADLITPSFGFAMAAVRVGCLLAGCCAGAVSNIPWAIRFPAQSQVWYSHIQAGLLTPNAPVSLPVHPLQIYFGALSLALGVFTILYERHKRYEGQLFLGFVTAYGFGQFLLEFLRFRPLPHVQYLAGALAAVSAVLLLVKGGNASSRVVSGRTYSTHGPRSVWGPLLVWLVVAAPPGSVRAQLYRRGGEFPINTVTEGDQRGVRLAPLPDGGFVVMWQSNGNVAVRRFDSNTRPLGTEFRVNTTPPGTNSDPSIAAASDGSVLIAWCALMPPNQTGILGRRFDPNGTPDASPFTILDQGSYGGSAVVADDDGFVVAWTDDQSYAGRARLVSASGLGPPFDLADAGNQYDFAAASQPDGSYRIVWYNEPIPAMHERRFDLDEPLTETVEISRVSSLSHTGPAICVHESGGFVVTWETYGPGEDTPASYRVYAASDIPAAAPALVTPEETEFFVSQARPMVACGPDPDFVIVWVEDNPSPVKIRGRGFNVDGQLPFSDFIIGLRDGGQGDGESIARLSDGDLLVAWTDCGLPSGCDVFGQRFTIAGATDCPGDCNRDGRVTVDELLQAVNIALVSGDPLTSRNAPLMKQCLPADVNLNYVVGIEELVQAVKRALEGCL